MGSSQSSIDLTSPTTRVIDEYYNRNQIYTNNYKLMKNFGSSPQNENQKKRNNQEQLSNDPPLLNLSYIQNEQTKVANYHNENKKTLNGNQVDLIKSKQIASKFLSLQQISSEQSPQIFKDIFSLASQFNDQRIEQVKEKFQVYKSIILTDGRVQNHPILFLFKHISYKCIQEEFYSDNDYSNFFSQLLNDKNIKQVLEQNEITKIPPLPILVDQNKLIVGCNKIMEHSCIKQGAKQLLRGEIYEQYEIDSLNQDLLLQKILSTEIQSDLNKFSEQEILNIDEELEKILIKIYMAYKAEQYLAAQTLSDLIRKASFQQILCNFNEFLQDKMFLFGGLSIFDFKLYAILKVIYDYDKDEIEKFSNLKEFFYNNFKEFAIQSKFSSFDL